MKQRIYFPLVILATIMAMTLFSCTKDTEPSSLNEPIWPFAIGNKWVYLDSIHNMYSWHTTYDSVLITDKKTINGIDGYYQHEEAPGNPVLCLGSDEQGNCIFVGGTSDINQITLNSIAYKNYPRIGEKWILHNANYSEETGFTEDTLSFTCEGIDIPVQTPAGTFTCNAYSHSYYSGTTIHHVDKFVDYFARGIGRVKSIHFEDGKIQSNSTLIRYFLK